jgi:hypothetical protein
VQWLGAGGQAALDSGLRDMSDMRLVERRSWVVHSNWKVFADNYLGEEHSGSVRN